MRAVPRYADMRGYEYMGKVDISGSRDRTRNVHEAFEKVHQLGHGTYGEVYLATDRYTGESVALKKIKLEACKEKRQGFPITALREVRVLKKLNHPNIVKLKEVCRSNVYECNGFKGSIYLVFEYLDHDLCGLHDRLQKRGTGGTDRGMSVPMAKLFMSQMLAGLAYCHSSSVMHRDLKASNLLISRDGQLKLADFGLARPFSCQQQRPVDFTYRVCTLWYRPPELLLGSQRYGTEVDIWSAGCILFELLAGCALFGGKSESAMLTRISELLGVPDWPQSGHIPAAASLKHYSRLPAVEATLTLEKHCQHFGIDADAVDLLRWMLTLDPAKRPSAQACLGHKFFTAGVPPMSSQQFREETSEFAASHEFNVKGKAKRLRAEEDHAEASTPEAPPMKASALPAPSAPSQPAVAGPPGVADHAPARSSAGVHQSVPLTFSA